MNLQENYSFWETCGENVRGGKKGIETHQKKVHKPMICPTCGVVNLIY